MDAIQKLGQIKPQDAPGGGDLGFLQWGTGAEGISVFLSKLVIVIYILAAVVFVFMILWGAIQWLSSGGEKERVADARNRILHAIIGIVIFAVAFPALNALGTFTGFSFFK